jgi:hypothetical protein
MVVCAAVEHKKWRNRGWPLCFGVPATTDVQRSLK